MQIYTAASLKFSSTTTIYGMQAVAGGRVELGARDQGIHGISIQAGDDIMLTSSNEFGLCSGGGDGTFTHAYYRLVE